MEVQCAKGSRCRGLIRIRFLSSLKPVTSSFSPWKYCILYCKCICQTGFRKACAVRIIHTLRIVLFCHSGGFKELTQILQKKKREPKAFNTSQVGRKLTLLKSAFSLKCWFKSERPKVQEAFCFCQTASLHWRIKKGRKRDRFISLRHSTFFFASSVPFSQLPLFTFQ